MTRDDTLQSLRAKPFCLSDDAVAWVQNTLAGLTTEQKIGQLFCLILREGTRAEVDTLLTQIQPGGIMYRPLPMERLVDCTGYLREQSPLPMLISANLEKGGDGAALEGTTLGSPLQVAATGDVDFARRLGEICATEGRAVGCNWTFGPIADIDMNFRNPITNTRSFGSDAARVGDMTAAYIAAAQGRGMATAAKHFPGDGCDERDQHLVTTVNDLSCQDWDATYGAVYRRCIDAGVLSIMLGHIMQPAWSKRLNPSLADADMLPASLAPELINGLLRGHLGFNGLVLTDATTMAGFTIPMPRRRAVPAAIAAGADMFLFSRNLAEDHRYMRQGVVDGTITPERLDEAVTRILGFKAALGLHLPQPECTMQNARATIGCAAHAQASRDCADRAVTLVKQQPGVLPLTPDRYPRLLLCPLESDAGYVNAAKTGVCADFAKLLTDAGFAVTTFVPPPGLEGLTQASEAIEQNYDAILYLANIAAKSNQTTTRIEWAPPMGADCPHYQSTVPTIFVSVENPYHLLDAPRVRTFVNAYNSNPNALRAVLDKLMGKSAFKGKSPVDAFCGKWDTRL